MVVDNDEIELFGIALSRTVSYVSCEYLLGVRSLDLLSKDIRQKSLWTGNKRTKFDDMREALEKLFSDASLK